VAVVEMGNKIGEAVTEEKGFGSVGGLRTLGKCLL
jgi:hypothetical protein